jgi:ribose/xylose/arabinose/galactoside ABC-type transport system permease subunit
MSAPGAVVNPQTLPGALSTHGERRYWSRYLPVTATGVLLLVAIGIGAGLYDNFLTGQVLANVLITNSHLIVLAVGMTFVILTGGIDLSVGAVVALSAMIASKLLASGWTSPAAIPIVLLTGSMLGLLVGLMIYYFKIQPFIATLAAMFLARGLCYVISIESIPIRDPFWVTMSQSRISILPNTTVTPAVFIALAVVAIGFFVLHKTRFGRTVYAIGGGESSASLMGLPVPRTKIGVYVVSGFCASLGSLLYTFNAVQSGNPLHAIGMELDAIAAVAIGGTLLSGGYGFVIGSLLGVLVLGTISTLVKFNGTLNSGWTRIATGLLVLMFIVMQRILTLGRHGEG